MSDKKKGKKGKKKESPEEEKDQMTAVDRQFYELTVADLNSKLARLRTHNAKLEEKNEDLESKMRQIEEDKSDTTAYLNRTLNEKLNIIAELEDKLSELSKVREAENIESARVMNEREAKYKAMHDQLTSEIKLLTGKLNSMEEFRIQRDELLAKFDAQETELKEQHKRHKAILYEMERKVILDKDLLRKEVENRLLQLSTEFTKCNEIRVAAHTQRLVRENIALNNEMDRVMFTIERLKREMEAMKRKHEDSRIKSQSLEMENSRLVRTAQGHLKIIEQLTDAYESLELKHNMLSNVHKQFETATARSKDAEVNLRRSMHKLHLMEQHVHAINTQRSALTADIVLKHQQMDHVQDVLNKVKDTIMSALKGTDAECSDFEFRMAQRESLLGDLLNILNELENMPTERPSIETIEASGYIYLQGDLGILPKESVETIMSPDFKLPSPPPSMYGASRETTPRVSIQLADGSDHVIDVISGSAIVFEDSEEMIAEEDLEGDESDGQGQSQLRRASIRRKSMQKSERIDGSAEGSPAMSPRGSVDATSQDTPSSIIDPEDMKEATPESDM